MLHITYNDQTQAKAKDNRKAQSFLAISEHSLPFWKHTIIEHKREY